MRRIAETAEKTTKRTRREAERRKHATAVNKPGSQPPALEPPVATKPAERPAVWFEEIEQW